MLDEWDLVLRVVAAGLLGGLIGYDREVHHKPAGIRTHALVAAGAALFVGVSVLPAQESGEAGVLAQAEVSRVLAGVVAGVGFLGAGSIIITREDRVSGLTTAAGIWVTAAVGSVIGLGYWITGIAGTVVIVLVYFVSYIAGRAKRGGQDEEGGKGP